MARKAHNVPRHTTETDYTPKAGQLGEWFLMFEIDQAKHGYTSDKTSGLYDYSWTFFAKVLESIQIKTMGPRKPLPLEQRIESERQIMVAVQARVNQAVEEGAPKAITVNTYLRNLQSFCNWCRRKAQKFLFTDFNEDFEQMRLAEADNQIVILADKQIEKFQGFEPKSFNQARVHTMGLAMLDNGVRIGGALQLQVRDVNFGDNMITILGKGNKPYIVQMSDEIYPVLRRYKTRYIDPYNTGRNPEWYFFGTQKGKQSSARNMERDVKVVYRKSGVVPKDADVPPRTAFHVLRHTCATKRLEAGWPIEKVQHMLNHEDLRTTKKYLHVRGNFLAGGFSETSPLNPKNLNNGGQDNWRREFERR
jgi:integrase/recombinase XerC